MSDVVIRPAELADVASISDLVVRTWRWAYVDIVAEDRMPTTLQERVDWAARGVSDAWVAEVASVLAGVAAIDPATRELTTLYVEPAAQGAGVGSALYAHAATELGSGPATLWIFRENGQARDFYHQRGWRLDRQAASAPGRCAAAPAIRLTKEL